MGWSGDDDLLDLIYGAAVEPELWVTAMERFADRIGGTSSWLSRLNLADATGPGIVARVDPVMPNLYVNHFAALNPLARVEDAAAYKRSWSLRILTDEDWMAKEALTATEYYNDFLRPQDIHSTMMIRLGLDGDEVSALSVNRPGGRGQFDATDLEVAAAYHAHLVRAFRLGGALATLELTGRDMADALDRSNHGVLLLEPDGRLRHANAAAQALFAGCAALRLVAGRLGAMAPDSERRLTALIARAASPDDGDRSGGSMTLPVAGRDLPLTITVSPLRAPRLTLFDRPPGVLVMIADPNPAASVSEAGLRDRFGLTLAETRVALGLLAGRTSREIAERSGVSVHTVRNQLRSLFEKTGVTRQSELVVKLLR